MPISSLFMYCIFVHVTVSKQTPLMQTFPTPQSFSTSLLGLQPCFWVHVTSGKWNDPSRYICRIKLKWRACSCQTLSQPPALVNDFGRAWVVLTVIMAYMYSQSNSPFSWCSKSFGCLLFSSAKILHMPNLLDLCIIKCLLHERTIKILNSGVIVDC